MPYLNFVVDNLVIYSPDGEIVEMTNEDSYQDDTNTYTHTWHSHTVTLSQLVTSLSVYVPVLLT